MHVMQTYGPNGLEARQVALIVDLDIVYVTRLLVSLRNAQRADSRCDERVHRWWAMDSTAIVDKPVSKWAHDVPLESLDAEHQVWTQKTLAPKPKYNPFGGNR